MKQNLKVHPKMIIEAVYKSKDGTWRGFCAPFDISCTEETAEKTMKALDELVELYIDGLKKYGYPADLTVKEVSDEEDREVLKKVIDYVIVDLAKKMKKNFEKFQRERKINSFKITDSIKAQGNYQFLPINNSYVLT